VRLALAAWTGLLAALPRCRAGGWRGAWVGFDIRCSSVFAPLGRHALSDIDLTWWCSPPLRDAGSTSCAKRTLKASRVNLLSAVSSTSWPRLAIAGAAAVQRHRQDGRKRELRSPVPPL
jgi:hypothetical protein